MRTFTRLIFASLFVLTSVAHAADHAMHESEKADGHLKFFNGKIHAHLYWEKGPIANDLSTLRVEFKEPKHHNPVDPKGQLTVGIWMPDMNHGGELTKVQPIIGADQKPVLGSLRVSEIMFSMAGQWELRFTLKTSDGKSDKQTWKVQVPDTPDTSATPH